MSMQGRDHHFVFAPFRLDPVNQQLWHGEHLMPLRPKLFAVLQRLVEHAGRLVTHQELRAAVWASTVVSESVLRGTIRELREALGDDAVTARFVETVPHRGYRFIAPVTVTRPPRPVRMRPIASDAATRPQTFIGRNAELTRLQQWLEAASGGARQVVFVTGEPGIGKTTVVDAFLASIPDVGEVRTARGQCVEHYGSAEAYLPVLEALGHLCRQPGAEDVTTVLSRYAPTWLAQMPGLIGDAELEAVQRRAQGATRERMLRELTEAIEALTATMTLVLILEDLHWSDYSTLDLIAMLAQRRTPARLMLLATYRPADVIVSGHPLKGMKQELRVHEQCEELPLRFLTDAEVGQYLAARFPHKQFPRELGYTIRRSTEGNPLFMVNIVDYWLSQHVLVEMGGQWQLAGRAEDLAASIPESLRHLIEKQLGRLSQEERRVLEAAGIAGVEFSTAAVAAALEEPAEHVEEVCERLAQRQQFLRTRGTENAGGRTVSARYGFRHALYQQMLYEQVAAARRVRLHRRIGERQEAIAGARVGEVAAELALHFERGHEPERALHYLTQAGQTALRRSAHPEAISLLGKGLTLLTALPATPERARHELSLQATLGAALAVTKGYASPEVEQAQNRAFQLCQDMGDAPQLFPVLAGLWGFRFLRAELPAAQELAAQLVRIAHAVPDPALLLWAHTLQGLTLSHTGDLADALQHLEQALDLYDPQLHGPDRTQVGAQDPKVTALAYVAWTLWRLGYPDQARKRLDESITFAQQLNHPFSLALALDFAGAGIGMFLRDVSAVQTYSEMHVQLCREQGFPYWLGWSDVRQGWVLSERGDMNGGITMMRQGMATLEKTGAALSRSYILAQIAEAHGKLGEQAQALTLMAEAMAHAETSGERWYLAELHRLEGTLRLPRSRRSRQSTAAAAACFRTAIEVAQRQQAKSLELRAVTSLSQLLQQQGQRQQAHALLSETYGWFSEGFDTADLRDARALLAQLR